MSSILILYFLILTTYAQKELLFEANELFKMGNYLNAMVKYRMYLIEKPDNKIALKQIGLCYLLSNTDKTKSIRYFEKSLELKKFDKDIWFYLADAYIHNKEFDKAENALNKYLEKPGKFKKDIPVLFNQISVSKKLMASPVNVTFTNLGKNVNTSSPEYSPFIDKKEKLLVYTSRKKGSKGQIWFDGFYPSDIYTSRFNGFTFSRSKNSKSLNSNFNEECVGITDDGNYIFVTINNYNASERGNVFKSKRRGSSYKRKQTIPVGMNTEKYYESSGIITENEEMIFTSSNNPKGVGGFDLYITRKLPNGKWGDPQNISEVNTELDEEFPYYNTTDSTLYFSSNGLPGMGGYDLFKSKWNPVSESWSNPENIGYPINSSYDEKTICFNDDNSYAYTSSVRKGGFGNYDIYRLKFEDHEIKPALYVIKVIDVATELQIDSVEIEIIDNKEVVIGKYKPNEKSGLFTVIMHTGHFKIRIKANGYKTHYQKFNISEFSTDKQKNELIYKLVKK